MPLHLLMLPAFLRKCRSYVGTPYPVLYIPQWPKKRQTVFALIIPPLLSLFIFPNNGIRKKERASGSRLLSQQHGFSQLSLGEGWGKAEDCQLSRWCGGSCCCRWLPNAAASKANNGIYCALQWPLVYFAQSAGPSIEPKNSHK
jgi:hypothetical protein